MTLSIDILIDRAIQERIAAALETQPAEDGADGFTVTYIFTVEDFGDGWTQDIKGPAGLRGKVVHISLYDVTETFIGTTSAGPVQVGDQGGNDTEYAISEAITKTLQSGVPEALSAREGLVGTVVAGDDLIVTGVQNIGGSVAGKATVALTIKYFI